MSLNEKLINLIATFKNLDTKRKILILSIPALFLLLFLFLIFILSPKSPLSPVKLSTQPSPTSSPYTLYPIPYTLIYGVWSQNNSLIKQYDMQTGQEITIAELPRNIKKVTLLSNGDLIYINKTDHRDHGEEVTGYSGTGKKSVTLFKTEPGFGIDDYVISPNKRYLATWEVKFATGSAILQGGNSKVLSVDLQNPAIKNLIYDETSSATSPVHYPRAVTDTGDIYSDTFLPNSGAGWAYGMSISNFSGTTKEDLPQMKNGTYGTQPSLSPAGGVLAFAGYSGGDGASVENGFRKALLAPNTVELFNIQTGTREKLPNLPSENLYTYVAWDELGGNLVFSQISKNANLTGFYIYDLSSKTARKINLEPFQIPIASLQKDKILFAKKDPSETSLGNLGQTYSNSITNFSILDINTKATVPVNLNEISTQFITLISSKAKKVLGESIGRKMIQLIIQALPDLAPTRANEQSNPPPPATNTNPAPTQSTNSAPSTNTRTTETPRLPNCDTMNVDTCLSIAQASGQAAQVCKSQLPSSARSLQCTGAIRGSGPPTNNPNAPDVIYLNCLTQQQTIKATSNVCNPTPLYLYGPSGLNVKIQAETGNRTFDVILPVDPIHYSFTPAITIIPPSNGVVSSQENLSNTLEFFAAKLGLNKQETGDLINYGKTISSPFVFVSFFDEKTSKKILPLKFDPQPDTYINIVIYFKPLQQPLTYTPNPPNFPDIPSRGSFTAVEISEFLDQ